MKQQIKITIRRLYKERVYAIVNVIGLSIGMASALLILLFVQFETSYDKQHPNHNRIYRVASQFSIDEQSEGFAVSSAAIGPRLVKEFDQIEEALRVFYMRIIFRNLLFMYEESRISDELLFAVDSNFFNFFSCNFIEGDPSNALDNPFSMVLTKELAIKHFGHTKIVGEKVELKDAGYFTITAVVEDPPLNTHLPFKALVSLSSVKLMPQFFENAFTSGISWENFENSYGSFIVWTYLKTVEGFNHLNFYEKNRHKIQEIHQSVHQARASVSPFLQPISSIHLNSSLLYELSSEIGVRRMMNQQIIIGFLSIALFLLFVAAINYTNISISHFNKRKKEMAIYRILGSRDASIFVGYFLESFITSLIALMLALLLLEVAVIPVNKYLSVNLTLDYLKNYSTLIIVMLILLLSSLITGLVPAIYYSSTNLTELIRSKASQSKRVSLIKKILMMLQFALATFMVVSSLIILRQVNYNRNLQWGFKTKNIATIEIFGRESKLKYHKLDSILLSDPLVKSTAPTDYIVSDFPIKHSSMFSTQQGEVFRSFYTIYTSKQYLDMMGISSIDGSEIQNNFSSLVNKSLIDKINLLSPTKEKITTLFQFLQGRLRMERKIDGVLDNFHYILINRPVEPLVVLPMRADRTNYIAVEFHKSSRRQKEEALYSAWEKFGLEHQLEFSFLVDRIEMYSAHQRNLAQFLIYFAIISIIIAFLGVYGITAYNISQRSVEISIRKTFGATEKDVYNLLFGFYIKYSAIGFIIGLLFSWFVLKAWLSSFAYSAPLYLWHFFPALLIVGTSVLVAVGIHIHSIRSLNPSIALRQE